MKSIYVCYECTRKCKGFTEKKHPGVKASYGKCQKCGKEKAMLHNMIEKEETK